MVVFSRIYILIFPLFRFFYFTEKSLLNKVSLFCQWTIAKVVAEVESTEDILKKNKIILECEDFLSTVDQGQDFTKYTSKIGNFNLNYFKQNDKH